MRYQERPYSCGASAILNAGRALGAKFSERSLRAVATTEEFGVDEPGMERTIQTTGVLEQEKFNESDLDMVIEMIRENVVIISTEFETHWETIVGHIGDRFIVANPTKSRRNMKENGVHVLSRSELAKRWRDRKGFYFGIIVRKKRRNDMGSSGRSRVSKAQ